MGVGVSVGKGVLVGRGVSVEVGVEIGMGVEAGLQAAMMLKVMAIHTRTVSRNIRFVLIVIRGPLFLIYGVDYTSGDYL
jgi:hypothetical protein